jgi:hypothetical protein
MKPRALPAGEGMKPDTAAAVTSYGDCRFAFLTFQLDLNTEVIMKTVNRLTFATLLILSALALSGCFAFLQKRSTKTISSFPAETAPSQVIYTEDQWVMLNNVYGSSDYSISIGDDLNSVNSIYQVNNVSIWYIVADDSGVAWCEKSDELYSFKIFVFENNAVETVFQVETEKGYQPQNVGLYLNTVYYCFIDYDEQNVQVIAYDIATRTSNCISRADFKEKNQPYSINLQGEFLSFICSDEIRVCSLQNNETVFDCVLPGTVNYVFSASYDRINDTCAVYYADNDSEDIGILKDGEGEIKSVFTFSENHYAYQDRIECHDGHIYWISQASVSGTVSDHYRFIDYNYLKDRPTEITRTFSYCRNEDGMYLLRFNRSGEYTHIDLCRY